MEIVKEPSVTLTKNQQYCFNRVEEVLPTMQNFFIGGKPGVGKSVLINYLNTHGKKDYDLAAPTGLAALNINGRTLHSIFKIPVSQGIIDPSFNNFPNDDFVKRRIQGIRYLIIDEVSMLRADTFDYLDRCMRFFKDKTQPFGGAQIILIGDFYQLPPVCTRDAYHDDIKDLQRAGYSSPFIFSARAFKGFEVLILDEVLRQKGDPDFIDLLSSARNGSVHPNMLKKLNERVGLPEDIRIKLCATNAQAEAVNQGELKKLDTESHTFDATMHGDMGIGNHYPAEKELRLKVGAQVMVKKNGADRRPGMRDPEFVSRVVNGTLGKVAEIHTGGTGPQMVTLELPDGEFVDIYRQRWERKKKVKNEDGKWEEEVIASYEQMPLTLAWAISMHKSQGQSFDRVHVDLSKVFAPGQAYVALSRCRSMAGLSLEVPATSGKFWTDRNVMEFFEGLDEIKGPKIV